VIGDTGNCGNTSAVVGPFALLRGLIHPVEPVPKVRIYNTNTKKGYPCGISGGERRVYQREDFRIDGVPGSGSKILLDFIGSGVGDGEALANGEGQRRSQIP
jgi:2-methylaconitate cis-trans-isomerase PrpF